MRKKKFIMVIIISVVFILPIHVNAEELYSQYFPLRWVNFNGSIVSVYWIDYNCSTNNPSLSSNLSGGMNYWGSLSNVSTTNTNSATNCVTHAIPTQTWWETLWEGNYFYYSGTAAMTFVYDTNYMCVTENNVASSTGLLQIAYIYYNPAGLYNYTSTNYQCLIAHEVGHALGFGHVPDEAQVESIMKQGKKSYTSIPYYDITQLNNKYS